MKQLRFAVAVLCLAVALPAIAFIANQDPDVRNALAIEPPGASVRGERLAEAEPSAAGAAATAFRQQYAGEWTFSIDRRTGRSDMIQGSGIPLIPGAGNRLGIGTLDGLDLADGRITAAALEPKIRALIEGQSGLLLPPRGTLVFDDARSQVREDGRLISVYFTWLVDEIPVEGARVFARINSGNVTQMGAPLVGPIDLDTSVVVDSTRALERLFAYTGDGEVAQLRGAPRLVIQPQDAAGKIDYRLVWKAVYRIQGKMETWEGSVDAHTGEIVGFRDLNHYAQALGGVYPRTVFENNETIAPMPLLDVVADQTVLTADEAGAYAFAGGDLSSGMNGRFFDTNCEACTNPEQPSVERSVGSGRVDFGLGGEDEAGNGFSSPSDRNTYFHLNQVRRIGKKWLPSFTYLDFEHFPANVNIQSSCNAVYTGFEVNFFRAGGNCNNTGEIADVVYHEYGHGMDLESNSGDGATGEATADVISMQITHSPLVGPGFNTNGSPVRNLDKDTTSKGLMTRGNAVAKCGCGANQSCGPLGAEVHCEGEIYGQAAWDLGVALAGKHGHHTGWRTSERIAFTSLPDASSYLHDGVDPVYDAYINADDDNGNLADGTPNGEEIFDAFDLHEIAGVAVGSSTPCTRPAQPTTSVTPLCDRFDVSWNAVAGADHYEVFRGELREDQAFFPVASVPSGQTTFSDTGVMPGVSYWYVVMAVNAAGCESTIESPMAATLLSQPILDIVAAVDDDEPRGNRSGFADPGEEVDLVLTLGNVGDTGATLVSGTVASSTPGVTMLLDQTVFSDLAAGGSGDSQDEVRFEADDQIVTCGDTVRFEFDPDEGSGCAADTSYFNVTMGERISVVEDDFETDQGWQHDGVNSTASTGTWTLGDPVATGYQPGSDVTTDGSQCWYTGLNPDGNAGQDDVDDGVVILLSPTFDLSGLDGAELSYYRWFALSQPGTDPGDFFLAEASDDDGATWAVLESLNHNQPMASWLRRSFRLENFIDLTNEVRFRFHASDGVTEGSLIEAAIDELRIDRFLCDDTPACFVQPTFDGLEIAASGGSCGEVDLSWQPALSNCINAEITYNLYRSTTPGFTPGAENLVAGGLTSLGVTDILLDPGVTYHYVVRAYDSRSGEEDNVIELAAVSPETPDIGAPVFAGIETALSGDSCGETVLGWSAGLESCNLPVAYDVYRSTDPGFVPGPATLVGSTFSTDFVDAGITAGDDFTYVVRARDALGNGDTNEVRLTAESKVLDLTLVSTAFEPNDFQWEVIAPNDATAGNWEWGDPSGSAYQSEDDATALGVNAWITELAVPAGNGDVDDGTTTLLSDRYNLVGAVAPVVRYSRWFTNDRGGSPGEPTDTFRVDISNNDGGSWTALEEVGAGTPLEWVAVELPVPIAATNQMRVRYTAADIGAGSLVEAGVDDFSLVDPGQGCNTCGPASSVCSINVGLSGDDVVLSWTGLPGKRVTVYHVSGCGEAVKLGTTEQLSFVHEGAALSPEAFNYRVTVVDNCGVEIPLGSCVDIACE